MKLTLEVNLNLNKASDAIVGKVCSAVYSTAEETIKKARSIFRNDNQKRTSRFDSLEDGIIFGKFKKGSVISISVHGYGYNDPQKHLYKTRFFVGGTKQRYTSKGYRRGQIQANNAIEQAISQEEFVKRINVAINGSNIG